jgi:alkylmercury lyase-like protein
VTDATELDLTYHFILTSWTEHGHAPHVTDIARAFGVSPDEGRKRLHDLIATGLPNWLFPGTDLIASFAPFHALPSGYRITVDGRQHGYAQCGFESIAASFVFHGRTILVDATCLDCGGLIRVEVRDGIVTSSEPDDIVGYVDVPTRDWRANLAYT